MQQLKPLTLRRNFSWTFTGNVVYAACQWGMLMVLAKLGSPEMVGQFTLGIAVTTPVIMFTNLQLRAVQATDARNEYLFSDYLGLRLLGTGLALLVIAGITIFARYRWETSLVILVLGFAKAFESISDVFYGLIQQHEHMNRIALSLMIKGPLSLLLLGMGVYLTGDVLGGAVGLAIAWAIILFSYDVRSGLLILKNPPLTPQGEVAGNLGETTLRPRWHLRTLGKLFWTALPLGFVMMLISLNNNIPRYFIERYLSERELGIFAAIAYLMVAGNMVVSALADSASPRLAKYYTAGNSKAFRTLLLKLVGIGALLGGVGVLVAVVAGREILNLLYRPEYAQRLDVFFWVMVAAGIGYMGSFLGFGITATRAFNYFTIPYLIVTAILAGFSQLLIPSYGLVGAAWALCAASLAACAAPIVILISIKKGKNHESPPRALS